MFASEHWHVAPDITTVAKGLTGGYAPIGAAIASKSVADTFTGEYSAFNHRFTFGGNPAACAAGLATLDIIEREGLVENACVMGDYLYERALERYLLGRGGDIFPLAPSLCVTCGEIDDLLARLDAVLSGLDRRLRYER
jgi:adenosylmethionine-8-amino-7-oxononanoate aminotransferase